MTRKAALSETRRASIDDAMTPRGRPCRQYRAGSTFDFALASSSNGVYVRFFCVLANSNSSPHVRNTCLRNIYPRWTPLSKDKSTTVRRRCKTFSAALVLRPLDYVTKRVSGMLACELPLDVNPVAIHTTIPGPSLLAQASDVSDSAFA